MLIGATAAGRKKVGVNPTTKLSRAIHGDKGILLTKTNLRMPRELVARSRDQIRTSGNPPLVALRGMQLRLAVQAYGHRFPHLRVEIQ